MGAAPPSQGKKGPWGKVTPKMAHSQQGLQNTAQPDFPPSRSQGPALSAEPYGGGAGGHGAVRAFPQPLLLHRASSRPRVVQWESHEKPTSTPMPPSFSSRLPRGLPLPLGPPPARMLTARRGLTCISAPLRPHPNHYCARTLY